MKLLYAFTVFVSCASATTIKPVEYVDTFDKPPNFNPALPLANPVGATAGGGLSYNGWSYARLLLSSVFLKTNTAEFNIGAGVTAELTNGLPTFVPVNASVKYFTPKSIYYACQAYTAAGQPALAIPCTIRASAVKAGSSAPITQDFPYTPSVLPPLFNTFTKGTFKPTFSKIAKVTFDVVPALQGNVTVVDLDTHSYTAYIEK